MHRRAFLLAFAALVAVPACTPPEPPSIAVKKSTITSIDLKGMRVAVEVEATNKNKFDFSIASFDGTLALDGKEVGKVTLVKPVVLPPGGTTLEVPLFLTWNDAAGIAQLAIAGRDLPYVLDGTASVGGSKLTVAVPIKVKGSVPKEELAKTVQRSFQNLPFGLPK